jgi:predicted DCC family thiol-disulfide oxidoreductase YuxK
LNQFLLKRDHHDRLRFASLQSKFAREILERHGCDASDLDTVYVVLDYGRPIEQVLDRSDAILRVIGVLGGAWKLAAVAKLLPKFIRNAIYNLVATNRYRMFGKSESCMLPEPRHRAKFLEI